MTKKQVYEVLEDLKPNDRFMLNGEPVRKIDNITFKEESSKYERVTCTLLCGLKIKEKDNSIELVIN